jgi:putative peptidoglycan lipid II flippase
VKREGEWRDPALPQIGRLMAPGVAGLAITQLNVFITTLLASFLVQGSVSYLYYAFRLVHLPIGLVGVAVATATFPAMASAAARRSPEDLRNTLAFGLRMTLFLTVPALLGLVVYRHTIIHLLFERGEFTPVMTTATASVLLGYCLGLCFFVANRVLIPAFYSFQDTVTPVKAGAIAVAVNIILSLLLMKPLGATGLAVATSLASLVNFFLLIVLLRRHLGPFSHLMLGKPLQKTALAGLCMAGALVLLQAVAPTLNGKGLILEVGGLLSELGIGTAVFFGVAAFLRSDEVKLLRGLFQRWLA